MHKVHGFLNVHKPVGMTSFAVVKRIRGCLGRSRVGHLGTLDPMAEGVLPVALGQATRLIEFASDVRKGYRAEATLGAISDTQDAWGCVTPVPARCDFSRLDEVLAGFVGEIEQVPPMHSAVHHRGERLYELARRGESVQPAPRRVTIYRLQLLGAELEASPPRLWLEVECSKGTYIRTLCHDIGLRLGCGAYLSALTRVFSGPFHLDEALPLDEVLARLRARDYSCVLPVDFPLQHLAAVQATGEWLERLGHGHAVPVTPFPAGAEGAVVRVNGPDGRLRAVGHLEWH
ncbi:MAG: tRNA pseudouridine(55) synthase TruB, partial [Syntrophomonadaceae bacterium]|nr:tRNA pseudouridine(55) synthase TruB [Syntrophomonadaceae bacterium]